MSSKYLLLPLLFIVTALSPNLFNSHVSAAGGEWIWYLSGGNGTYGCKGNTMCPLKNGSCSPLGAKKTFAKCGCDNGPGEWMSGYYRCQIPTF